MSSPASNSPHSGFAALIGASNVGKSTLLNRLVGAKLSIVSPKPQTTRGRVLGVITRPKGQVAFIDTPGLQAAKGSLRRYLARLAVHALSDADLALFMIEPPRRASQPIPEVNRSILDRLAGAGKPSFLVINKIDQIAKPRLLPLIESYRQHFPFAEVAPVSAKTGDGVQNLLQLVLAHLPEGDPMFDAETLTDQAERALVAEYIREQILLHCREEIPHSTAVTVDSFDESEREPRLGDRGKPLAGLVRIQATIHLERESQRSIVIGKGGKMLKTIGIGARASIEQLLRAHVYLSVHVRVEPRWSERPEALKKLGYG
jgi:GTPase